MLCIKMADLMIEIHNHYDYVEKMCADYRVEGGNKADLVIEVTEEAVLKEQQDASIPCSLEYCESICIYREISKKLIQYQGFLMHGACIEIEGEVYVFCAKSGTGKSTHLALWKKHFGEKARIINGDKPIIRWFPGREKEFVVYGTPWCGKEEWNINTSGNMKAICFLERGEKNEIHPIPGKEAIKRLGHQILMPKAPHEMISFLDMIDVLLKTTPCYLLSCNMEVEAAVVAYHGMNIYHRKSVR